MTAQSAIIILFIAEPVCTEFPTVNFVTPENGVEINSRIAQMECVVLITPRNRITGFLFRFATSAVSCVCEWRKKKKKKAISLFLQDGGPPSSTSNPSFC